MAKNTGVLGIAAVLLIIKGRGSQGLGSFQPEPVLSDLHRIAGIVNRMDQMGQMALHPPKLPSLPPPGELLSSDPADLKGLMEAFGPVLSAFGSSHPSTPGDGRGDRS